MRGRNYSPCSTLENMRRFWVCCRLTLPWDYFTFARDPLSRLRTLNGHSHNSEKLVIFDMTKMPLS
jgi:hypothetical protein